jgi:hypothetical protein
MVYSFNDVAWKSDRFLLRMYATKHAFDQDMQCQTECVVSYEILGIRIWFVTSANVFNASIVINVFALFA